MNDLPFFIGIIILSSLFLGPVGEDCVDINQLIDAVSSFYEGDISISEVIEMIRLWKEGCLCEDGTAYGNCSASPPWYCDQGSLIESCGICGCSAWHECLNNACVLAYCNDSTAIGECVAGSPPLRCSSSGQHIEDCLACGCPEGHECQGSGCRLAYCPDGTAIGQCVTGAEPLFCGPTGDYVADCSACGCPPGQQCLANGSCVPCQNECPYLGAQECAGIGYRVCGYHDSDPCLEWGSIVACGENETCIMGSCSAATGNQTAIFAINEGNFNTWPGIRSYYAVCADPDKYAKFIDAVENDPLVNQSKVFTSGWSCGATYALIYGLREPARFRGIMHLHQASIPAYRQYIDDALDSAGGARAPVYIVHDFSYDSGGALLRDYLIGKGYQLNVDLFVMHRPGTGHDGHLTEAEKQALADWMDSVS